MNPDRSGQVSMMLDRCEHTCQNCSVLQHSTGACPGRYSCRLCCDGCLAVRTPNVPLSMSNLLRPAYKFENYSLITMLIIMMMFLHDGGF